MRRKIRRLINTSFSELVDRSRQGLHIFAERLAASPQGVLSGHDDDEKPSIRFEVVDAIFSRIRSKRGFQLGAFADPAATMQILRSCYPDEEKRIVGEANKIGEGLFDLLGYQNLHFRSNIPDWHFEPVLGKSAPKKHWSKFVELDASETGDKKIPWELSRHQYFVVLGQAYWLTGDERYTEIFIAHVRDWCEQNPPKVGINWISSLEVSLRSISWIVAIQFFVNSKLFTSELLHQMLAVLYANGRHVSRYLSTFFSPNTHLTGEAIGLYYLGTFFPELPEAEKWRETGNEILATALGVQVRDDGTYCEQSSHYHRYTSDFYLNLLLLKSCETSGIVSSHRQRVESLLDTLLHLQQPDGKTPLFGDEDGGRLFRFNGHEISDFRPTLALGSVLLNRGDMKFAAQGFGEEVLWLLGPVGHKQFKDMLPIEPAETARAFRCGGFFVARDSWESNSNYILVDCGEHGFLNGGHAHADSLSFIFSLDGRPIFIDSGTYNYTADLAARGYFRSTSAHNALTVNAESSSIPKGPFSWETMAKSKLLHWSDTGDYLLCRGSHDGFDRYNLSYEREFYYFHSGGPTVLEIVELVDSSISNAFEINFVLAPDFSARISDNGVDIFDLKDKAGILNMSTHITCGEVTEGGGWSIEDCFISPIYGCRLPSRKLVYRLRATGKFEIRTALRRPRMVEESEV